MNLDKNSIINGVDLMYIDEKKKVLFVIGMENELDSFY